MSSKVVSLSRLFRRNWDWSSQELAEFYRVETALLQAGLRIDTERGVSEGGDPWFVFCRQDGEVIVHIARIDGEYILAGSSYEGIARGSDIGTLVRNLIARHPLVQMPGAKGAHGSNVYLHPAALLVAIVATAFFKTSEARAIADGEPPQQGRAATHAVSPGAPSLIGKSLHNSIAMDAAQIALILTAVSALFDGKPIPATDPIVADPAADHVGSTYASAFQPDQLSLSSASARSSLLPLTSAELPRTDDSGGADMAQVQGIDIKALPLIAVLWDLSSQHLGSKSAAEEAHSGQFLSGAQSGSMHAGVDFLPYPLLIVSMRPADGSLGVPVVQSAKISFSAGDGTVQTHEIQHLDQLPAVLVGVLQGAVHTQVQWTLVGGSAGSSSLADTLISTITTSGSTMKDATAIATADHSSPDAVSTQSHDVAAATSHGAAVSAVELQAILESFIQSTPNYSIIVRVQDRWSFMILMP